MLSHLFIAALWSPAGKGLTSQLLFVTFNLLIWYPIFHALVKILFFFQNTQDNFTYNMYMYIGTVYASAV